MDQERIGIKVKDVYKITAETILKAMYYLLEESYQRIKMHEQNKSFTGQTSWNKFLATKSKKHFQEVANSELNMKRLEAYLDKYEVGFAVKDNGDGTSTIAIDAKNIEALETSFKKVIDDLTDPDASKEFAKKVVKDDKSMTVEEKIERHSKQIAADVKQKIQIKDVGHKLPQNERSI